jgi:hypothetical protein
LRILHCSFAAGVSFAMTAAVVVRMLCLRRRVIKYLGREHARVYTSAVAVFVESNALFSMFTIVCAIPGTHIIGPTYFSFANYTMVHAAVCRRLLYWTSPIYVHFAGYLYWSACSSRSLWQGMGGDDCFANR